MAPTLGGILSVEAEEVIPLKSCAIALLVVLTQTSLVQSQSGTLAGRTARTAREQSDWVLRLFVDANDKSLPSGEISTHAPTMACAVMGDTFSRLDYFERSIKPVDSERVDRDVDLAVAGEELAKLGEAYCGFSLKGAVDPIPVEQFVAGMFKMRNRLRAVVAKNLPTQKPVRVSDMQAAIAFAAIQELQRDLTDPEAKKNQSDPRFPRKVCAATGAARSAISVIHDVQPSANRCERYTRQARDVAKDLERSFCFGDATSGGIRAGVVNEPVVRVVKELGLMLELIKTGCSANEEK